MKGLRNLLNRLSDIKTRTLFIVVGIIVIVVVAMVLTTSREMKPPEVAAEVKAARIGEITSLPGTGEYNEEYAKLQLAENQRLAQEAQKTGEAAIPRLINQPGEGQANLSFGQEFCAECVYDAQGYDKNGYDAKGYNREGYNAEGYNVDGYNQEGFDREGYDQQGFNKDGFDRNGFDREGFDKDGFNRAGYDRNGFDRNGYDQDGYNKEGFDQNGCNREGLDVDGNPCYDAQGFNAQGYDKFGYDAQGYDQNGFDKDGYDRNGFNSDGCNRLGLDAEGNPCFDKDGYDVLGYNKDGFDREGFNKDGYDAAGYNREGFDKDGFDRAGFDREGYGRDGFNKEGFNRDGCNRQGFDRNGQPCGAVAAANAQTAEEAYRQLLAEQQKVRDAQLTAEQQAQNRERQAAEQRAMQQAFESLLQSQSTSVISQWEPGKQMYVRGAPITTEIEGGAGENTNASTAGPVLYKAGSIVFAVLDTALNSDEPGPVLATIVQGPLEGSKVLGTLQRQEDKLLLRFNLVSSPDLPNSVPFDAVAIDAETARTALATGVDNHYFLRYGTLFASAFLEGMGEAILAGITQPVLEVDNEVLVVQSADVTTGQALLVGAGTVGQKWGEHLGEIFNKPPTVTVDSGTGIGLLFMKDFTVNEGSVPEPSPAQQPTLTKVNETTNVSSSEQAR